MVKKRKSPNSDYEAFRRGPLIFERHGREFGIRSEWKPGEHEKYVNNLRENLPKAKDSINKKITELQAIIHEYDPLEIMQTTTIRNILETTDPENEETQDKLEAYAEYAQSLMLAFKRKGKYKHATEQAINDFNRLISEIYKDVYWYLMTSTGFLEKTEIEKNVRIDSLTRFLFIRGDSIPEHHNEMIVNIFSKCDDFFTKHYNISTTQIYKAFSIIEIQIQENLDKTTNYIDLYKAIQIEFDNFIENKVIKSAQDEAAFFKEFQALPSMAKRLGDLAKKWEEVLHIAFEIKEERELTKALLDLLSATFGDNHEFINFEKAPAWPTNNSIILEKPLINFDNRYYCFLPTVLARNIGNILELLIYNRNPDYFNGRYRKIKAEYLESKSFEYFQRLLPGAKLYRNLFYNIEENGNKKRVETDGIILFDNNIFIIEAKAGSLSQSARRGSVDRIKKNIKELIDNAYKQAIRTKEYIESSEIPEFEKENGNIALSITNKENFKNIFIINTTLELLGGLATHLSSAKDMNLIIGKEWPWSIYINDLRVISELAESPSIFIHYLKRRIKTNDYPQFKSSDELDYYMYYLLEGLYFDDNRLSDKDRVSLYGYTNSLDRYYDYLAGRVTSGERPTLKIPKTMKDLIIDIESSNKYGFTSITTFLLRLSAEGMRQIIYNYNNINEAYKKDRNGHQFTMALSDKESMLIIATCNYSDLEYINKIKGYLRIKMYQTKRSICAFIIKKISPNGKHEWEHDFIEKKWKYDSTFEPQVNEFKRKKWEKADPEDNKIGRNTKCPCGSGLKYKHCCGK